VVVRVEQEVLEVMAEMEELVHQLEQEVLVETLVRAVLVLPVALNMEEVSLVTISVRLQQFIL
jgi:hypothetical protein